MTATRMARIPGLADDIVLEVGPDLSVHPANRRSTCVDCGQVVRVNDTADRFWPWVANDGSTICSAPSRVPWGHRVPHATAAWLVGEA